MDETRPHHRPTAARRLGWRIAALVFFAMLLAQGLTFLLLPMEPMQALARFLPATFLFCLAASGLLALILRSWLSPAEDPEAGRLTSTDPVTGLLNRTAFIEKLKATLRRAVLGEHGRVALISVDIDGFKYVNDTLGHTAGDSVLHTVGQRILKSLPHGSALARASADEFAAIVPLGAAQPDSAAVVERVFAAMLMPVEIGTDKLQVRVSIGVAHGPDDGIDANDLMKNTNIALTRAKKEGRDTVRYYSHDFDQLIQHRFQLLRDLHAAIAKAQLRVYYQPQVDLKTGKLLGAEALLRWWLPSADGNGGRFISPAEFVPLAEESGLIVPIGEFAMRTACEAAKKWQDMGLPPLRVAVNLSGVQFHRSDVVGLVETTLAATKLPPRLLELEVTESIFMENISHTAATLKKLHDLGVTLAIDDFGTGYSSLGYLRQFPVDRIKIDQSFIRNATTEPDDRVIVRTIISLGHNLGMKVVAEGVETQDHVEMLKVEGCDEAQGYRYAKPLPEDEFIAFVKSF